MQKLKNNEARPKFTGSYKKSVYVTAHRPVYNVQCYGMYEMYEMYI